MNFMHYMNTIVSAEETGWSCGAVQGADPGTEHRVWYRVLSFSFLSKLLRILFVK